VNDTAPPPPASEPAADAGDAPTPDTPGSRRGRGRRGLPVGPVGLLAITAVALAAAFGVAWLVVSANTDDPVDVRTALQQTESQAPVVPAGTKAAEVGDPAPDVRLDYLDGGVQQLSELKGTPVVLNFWSSTCAPCLSEMPAFEKVHKALGDQVVFVGVDVTDTRAAGESMVARTGVTYRNARDPQAGITAAFGGTALPRTVVIGADGTVLDTHSGALSEEELTQLLHRNGVGGR